MYCGACGQENPDEHKFCSGCGKSLTTGAGYPVEASAGSGVLKEVLTSEKVARVGIRRQPGYLYVVDPQGDISRIVGQSGRYEKVAKVGIRRWDGYRYFVDRQGDISRTEEKEGQSASGVTGTTEGESRLQTLDTPLVKCRSCDKEIPRTAGNCPHCGEMLIKCPRCGGLNIACGQRGFGIGRALATGVVFGPAVGLLAGMAGRKQVELQCQQCGTRWVPNGR